MKKTSVLLLFAFTILTIAGCGIEVPSEYKDVVGEWMGPTLTIKITSEGEVMTLQSEGKVEAGSVHEEINGPLQEITDDHFTFGPGSFTKEFKIDKLPYEENGTWYWEVEGEKLRKLD